MHLELTDEQAGALVRELSLIVQNDRYPLSPRIVALREILDMLRPEPARPAPLLPRRHYEPPSKGRYRRRGQAPPVHSSDPVSGGKGSSVVMISPPPRVDTARPRLMRLRDELTAAVPCWPNTAEVRAELERYELNALLVIYTNWADRRIRPDKREVVYARDWDGPRAATNKLQVLKLAEKVEQGVDLTPHLSKEIFTHGYVPMRPPRQVKGPEWGDKDFALNAYDIHHVHLGRPNDKGHKVTHGKDLLYACFERAKVTFLFVGDHKSFDDGTVARAAAAWRGGGRVHTPITDRQRDLAHRHGLTTMEAVDGRCYIGNGTASSGHATGHWVNHLMKTMGWLDPMIDDPQWWQQMRRHASTELPDDPELAWSMNWCDLLLQEMKTGTYFVPPKCEWRR